MSSRSRFSAALYLVLVFASGILVGAVGNRLYLTSTVTANNTPPPRTMAQFRAQFVSEMKQKVGANDEQITKILAVNDEAKRKFDALHAQEKPIRDKIDRERVEGIRAVLNATQKTAYDQWRAERARIAAAKQQHQK